MSQASNQLDYEPIDPPTTRPLASIVPQLEAPVALKAVELAEEDLPGTEAAIEAAPDLVTDEAPALPPRAAEPIQPPEPGARASIPRIMPPPAPAISIRATVEETAIPRPQKPPQPKINPQKAAPKAGSFLGRFVIRHGFEAASLTLALGLGWIIGANTFDNSAEVRRLGQQTAELEARLTVLPTRPAAGLVAADIGPLRKAVDTLQANAKNAKATNDAARATLAANVNDVKARIDRLADDAQHQGASFTELAARMDRLEHAAHASAADAPTGTIAPGPKVAAAIPPPVLPLPPARNPPAQTAVAHDAAVDTSRGRLPANVYILRDVIDGSALVETPMGLRSVKIGDVLPGAGRVKSIDRHGRQWIVVTSDGYIDEEP